MAFRRAKIANTVLALSVIALLLLGVFGLPHFSTSMTMDEHGNMTMTDCYMPGMTAVCNMNALEHIASWQSLFTSIPSQNLALTLLLLALAAILGFAWIRQAHSPPQEARIHFQFSRRREYVPLATSLQELFSNGILNPKVF